MASVWFAKEAAGSLFTSVPVKMGAQLPLSAHLPAVVEIAPSQLTVGKTVNRPSKGCLEQ